jgi:hypothetical protein
MIKLPQIEEFIRTRAVSAFLHRDRRRKLCRSRKRAAYRVAAPAAHDIIVVYGNDGLVRHIDKNEILNAAVYGPARLPAQ